MKMKKWFIALVVLAFVATAFAGCGSGNGGNGGDADGETIKIGANFELSGAVAKYGEDTMEGIKLAVEEVNAAGGIDGKKVELVTLDNTSDSAEAKAIATRLATQENVLAIIGPATTGATQATIPVTEENQIAVITASGTADNLTVKDDGTVNEYIFRICFYDSVQGKIGANFAADNMGAKKVVLISDNSNDYSMGIAKSFKETLAESWTDVEIVREENITAGDTDFSAVLTNIKAVDFDMIYAPVYDTEAALLIKQARDLGIDAPIMGADGFDSASAMGEVIGMENFNNVFFTGHFAAGDPMAVDFTALYQEKLNKEPNGFNALGYDLANYVMQACERAEELTKEGVHAALLDGSTFSGVTGTFTLDEFHNPIKSVVVNEYVQGVPTFKARVEP